MKEEKIKELKEQLNKIASEIASLEKQDYVVGDKVKYKGLEWFVTRIKEDGSIELMLADKMPNELIEKVFDDEEMRDSGNDILFDKESYDWKESYIREQLNNKFLEVLGIDKSDLLEMTINYAEDEFTTDYVRIPTLKDIRKLPKEVIKRGYYYYLMNKGLYRADCDEYLFGNDYLTGAFYFDHSTGGAGTYGGFRVVRPVIALSSVSLLD